MLVARIPSSNKIDQRKFVNLQAGSLLVVDCGILENLRDAAARAVEDGSFRRDGGAARRHKDPELQRQAHPAEPHPQVLDHGCD